MYSIIDIESNGAGFRNESIIEIAIYKYDGHELVDQFSSLVNPESDITHFVQKLTSITPKMVKTAPKFHELAKRVIEITNGTTLVGHNVDFDYRMLRQSFKRLGYDFKINTLDTIPLAKKLLPDLPSYSLGKLCKSLGIPLTDEHRASGDARATLELLKLLIIKDKDNEIIQAHHDELNAKTYTNKIKELTQDLPSEKGILYFLNEKSEIIFCDLVDDVKSASIKIFNSKSKRWEKIQAEVSQILYDSTGTDLIAQLMLMNKGIHINQHLSFGLYYDKKKYFVARISHQKEIKPYLKFKTFSQGNKVLAFIKSKEEFADVKNFTQIINLKVRNQLLISKGRSLGEKSFLVIENGKLTGYGFYELHHQIQSREKIDLLKVSISKTNKDQINDLQLSLLKGDFEIVELPK